jgi:guanylate kinase
MNPFPLILSSPSGGGKTTIARMLLDRRADVGYSVSCTTRAPRQGETNGTDYFFLTREAFEKRRSQGEFAESAVVHGNLYGTLQGEVRRVLASGKHVIMDIDVQGARQFAAAFPESVLVFLLPPTAEVLIERLRARQTEDHDKLLVRLRSAREELREVGRYQYVVVNDNLEHAYKQVASIVDAETVRHERLPRLDERVEELITALDRQIHEYSSIRTG